MDSDEEFEGDGGSTPVQDENEYVDQNNDKEPVYTQAYGLQSQDIGDDDEGQKESDEEVEREGSDDDDENESNADSHVSDDGEIDNDDNDSGAERNISDNEEGDMDVSNNDNDNLSDAGPQSPDEGPESPNVESAPASPDEGPASPIDNEQNEASPPASPEQDSAPASPDEGQNYTNPKSPSEHSNASVASPSYSPEEGEGPQSPSAEAVVEAGSPSESNPASPVAEVEDEVQDPASPDDNDHAPQSPEQDGPASPCSDQPASPDQEEMAEPASPKSNASDAPASPESAGEEGPHSPMDEIQSPPQSPGAQVQSPPQSPDAVGPSSPVSPNFENVVSPAQPASPQSPGEHKDEEEEEGGAEKRGSGDEGERAQVDSDVEVEGPGEETEKAHNSDKDSGDENASDAESDKGSAVGELIADIFGSSDEEEEFEGFNEADVQAGKAKARKALIGSDDENEDNEPSQMEGEQVIPDLSDEDEDDKINREDFVSDFDLMMAKKKEEQGNKRRKRKDVDIINDNDDLIVDICRRMKEAANADRELNKMRKPALKKLAMLAEIKSQLMKSGLHMAFLDNGILTAITEWLAPLPDRSLPHLQIREFLLKILNDFPSINSDALKTSGVGKAVMYIYKHPREVKGNKEKAGKLINEWSRPIFDLTSNYQRLSKEEREQRDYEQLPKKRRMSSEGGQTPRRDIDKELTGEKRALRPGDPGWIYRARVPMPSNKDYVVRPTSNIEESYRPRSSGGKKELTRYEKHRRAMIEKKKFSKNQRAVAISIEGRNMSL